MTKPTKDWNSHYSKSKSDLSYPDENLVRLLAGKFPDIDKREGLKVLDIGCGSGRHLMLLKNYGFKEIYGTDYSLNALSLSKEYFSSSLINCNNKNLPFADNAFDIAIAWGSLHYSDKKDFEIMLEEAHRVLKKGGKLFATLRTARDSYLKTGTDLGEGTWRTGLNDLSGTTVSFFKEDELKKYFSIFKECSYGWMERTIIGDTSKVISHWVISAIA